MDTTIQKSYYYFLNNFIKNNLNMLLTKKIFIFGAGIRGCNLLNILKLYQILNIVFVDNNVIKQGKTIDGCIVISFLEADSYSNSHVFLCPIENGEEILAQLALTGRCENIDYFNLDYDLTDYLNVIEEIKRPDEIFSFAFGCCILSSNILGNDFNFSLGERLKHELFYNQCKLCTLPGFSPAMYYHILNASFNIHKNVPRFVFITMEISSCSPYAPVMLGKQNLLQHSLFIEQLIKLAPNNNEIFEYSQLINKRFKHSISEINPVKSCNSENSRRQVYKLKYNYNIREDDESVVFTKKTLALMKKYKIPVVLFFPPIDYMVAEKVCGHDFRIKYSLIINQIRSFISKFSYYFIDASFIMDSDCFLQEMNSPDINPFLNKKGQDKLFEFLTKQQEIQPLILGDNLLYKAV